MCTFYTAKGRVKKIIKKKQIKYLNSIIINIAGLYQEYLYKINTHICLVITHTIRYDLTRCLMVLLIMHATFVDDNSLIAISEGKNRKITKFYTVELPPIA